MKKYLIKAIAIPAIVMLVSIFNPSSSHAVSIGIDPDDTIVTVGDTFTLDVLIKDVLPGEPLNSFVFNIEFDPTVLSIIVGGITEGTFFSAAGPPAPLFSPGIPGGPGEVTFISGGLLFGGESGDGILATIEFLAHTSGSTAVDLVSVSLFGVGLLGPGALITPFSLASGDVKVDPSAGGPPPAPVPEPASVVLLGSGLLALILTKKRMAR